VSVNFEKSKIFIPKLKQVKCIFDRIFEGKIKTCTISKNKSEQYFISVLVELDRELPNKPKIEENTSIGIDLGLKDFAII